MTVREVLKVADKIISSTKTNSDTFKAPQSETNIRRKYETFFPHFSLRLSERYGLYITFEEYVRLCCKVPLINWKKRKSKEGWHIPCMQGFIYVQKTKIKVRKSIGGNFTPLLTALPITTKRKHDGTKRF